MADLSDIENALVALIAQTVYPNGTGQASAAGFPAKIYPGWPTQSQLDADLHAGTVHVTVFPRPEERNTTRYSKDWKDLSTSTPTITLTISGQTITVGGTVPGSNNPQNVAVIANGQSFLYAVQTSDTLTSIATALATAIAAGIPGTTNTGAVITLPSDARIAAARVGIGGTLIREVRRQERLFQITLWTDTPTHRAALAALIDPVLADTQFLTMADQTAARLIYKGSPITDGMQKSKLYRRDLLYTVEYATTQTASATQILTEQLNVTAQDSNQSQVGTVQVNL